MVLTFTGKGSAFYPVFGSTSGHLIMENELYVFDCGETVFDCLYRSGLMEKVSKVHVILTHLHADHVGSLGSLLSYSNCIQHRVVEIIHPSATVVELLDLLGIRREFYTLRQPAPQWQNDHLSLTAVPVPHVDNMACYGYIVKCNTATFFYSGDCAEVPPEVVEQYRDGRIQELYHDTATVVSPGHCHYTRLCELFPQQQRSNIFCMHLDGEHQAYLQGLGFSIAQ